MECLYYKDIQCIQHESLPNCNLCVIHWNMANIKRLSTQQLEDLLSPSAWNGKIVEFSTLFRKMVTRVIEKRHGI